MLLMVLLVVLHFHTDQNPAKQLALKVRRVALVSRMQLALASAVEAERSAVLATTSYARFSDTKVQILKLSRENTNVRSLSISLNQKSRVMLVCRAALTALQQAIVEEPITGMTFKRPDNPRKW